MRPNPEDRLAHLERDVRRVRVVLLLLLVVAAGLLLANLLPQGRAEAVAVFAATALLLAGAETAVHVWRRGQGIPDIVRAKKFEVVDERGHIFVEIGETTDGRGAVVTHDGDTHVILTPAHPPVMERREPTGEDDETVLTPAHDDGAPTAHEGQSAHDAGASSAEATPGSEPAPAVRAPSPEAPPNVNVELVYRGDGVYEAKITKPGDGARRPAATTRRR